MIDITLKKIAPLKLVGMSTATTAGNSQAVTAWKKFMPLQKDVVGKEDGVYFSVQEYGPDFPFDNFDPNASFTTWAAKEVFDFKDVPAAFSKTEIFGGLYATFVHLSLIHI